MKKQTFLNEADSLTSRGKVGIIDYGLGNLHSVKNALDYVEIESFISDDPGKLDEADGLILPGVGAFPDAMRRLKETRLDLYIRDSAVAKMKPLLGICLGMQILFDVGYEFEMTEGLGLVKGKIVKIQTNGMKIPHIGWNELDIKRASCLTDGLKNGDQVYFVHSYKAVVENDEDLIATTHYSEEIPAIIGHNNVYGCQFHPEKSGEIGLNILRKFGEIINACSSSN